MKFSKDKKKRKIEKIIWNDLIEIACLKSDGKCEVCNKKGEQRDHCISSTCAELRFDHRNISNLCAACHFKKTHKVKGCDVKVYDVVRRREGSLVMLEMISIASRKKPFQWTLTKLEEQEIEVKETLADLTARDYEGE